MNRAYDTKGAGETDRIIAEELERLLASAMFTRSPVLSRLLLFLVEHRLRGGRVAPKAYAIATEALGRSADFDPAVDSYPRVMVGRLRSLLDRYYAETPWVHRLRVPQGSYEVVVQYRTPPPVRSADERARAAETGDRAAAHPAELIAPHARPRPRYGLWAAALIIAGLVLFALWRMTGDGPRLFARSPMPMPLLEIAEPVSGDTPVSRALARALDGKLRDGLRRFELVDLRSAGGQGAEAASANRPDYRLDVSLVRDLDGPVDVTLVLNRVADQRTIWSQQVRLPAAEVSEFAAVEPVIAQIAGDYGVIVRDQIQRQPDSFAPGFPCMAQFNRMRQMRGSASASPVTACLRDMLRNDSRDPVALSALSWLRFGDWQQQRGTVNGKEAGVEARALAERAYESAPNTVTGLFAMARAHFYAGNCAGGNAMGDAALRLNPYDPDMSGFLGLFKATCGNPEEGERLLQRSLDLDASYPGVPAVTLAFLLSQRGEQGRAIEILDRMPSPSNMEPQYMVVRSVVLARQGRLPEARAVWRRLLVHLRQPEDASPEHVLRQFMITPGVIEKAATAVRDSGIATSPAAR